ncbi:hypothetical protein HDU67_007091 [Dinochytrium kinnereticum]|nr:hypothetical protein HDU67_007091 [Dinochytrium kinnereticum]
MAPSADPDPITLTPALLASRWTDGGVGGTNGGADRRKKKDEGAASKPTSAVLLQDAEAADCSNMFIDDIEDISMAVSLSRLNLSTNLLTEEGLEGIKHCANLTWLNLSGNRVESFRGLEGLSKLQVLNLSHNNLNRISDHVKKLTKLKALILNNNEIARIDNVTALTDLNTLVLSHNKISEIPPLPTLTNLTKLSLSHNNLRVFPDLSNNPTLRELRLSHNRIQTLAAQNTTSQPPLASLPALEILDLSGNLLTDLERDLVDPFKSSLLHLHLKNLNLRANPVCSVDGYKAGVLDALPGILVFDNERIDPKFLERKEKRKEREKREAAAEAWKAKKEAREAEKLLRKTEKRDHPMPSSSSKPQRPAKPTDRPQKRKSDVGTDSNERTASTPLKRMRTDDPPAKRSHARESLGNRARGPVTPELPKGAKRRAVGPGEDDMAEAVPVRGKVFKGLGPRPPSAFEEDEAAGTDVRIEKNGEETRKGKSREEKSKKGEVRQSHAKKSDARKPMQGGQDEGKDVSVKKDRKKRDAFFMEDDEPPTPPVTKKRNTPQQPSASPKNPAPQPVQPKSTSALPKPSSRRDGSDDEQDNSQRNEAMASRSGVVGVFEAGRDRRRGAPSSGKKDGGVFEALGVAAAQKSVGTGLGLAPAWD